VRLLLAFLRVRRHRPDSLGDVEMKIRAFEDDASVAFAEPFRVQDIGPGGWDGLTALIILSKFLHRHGGHLAAAGCGEGANNAFLYYRKRGGFETFWLRMLEGEFATGKIAKCVASQMKLNRNPASGQPKFSRYNARC